VLKFAEVRLPAMAADERLEVRLADGTTVRGTKVSEVVELLRALRA